MCQIGAKRGSFPHMHKQNNHIWVPHVESLVIPLKKNCFGEWIHNSMKYDVYLQFWDEHRACRDATKGTLRTEQAAVRATPGRVGTNRQAGRRRCPPGSFWAWRAFWDGRRCWAGSWWKTWWRSLWRTGASLVARQSLPSPFSSTPSNTIIESWKKTAMTLGWGGKMIQKDVLSVVLQREINVLAWFFMEM